MKICRKDYIVEALMMAPHPPGGPKREQIKNVHGLWSRQLICAVNWLHRARVQLVSLFSSTKSRLQCGVPSCAPGPVKPCPAPVTSLIPTCQSKASWLTPPSLRRLISAGSLNCHLLLFSKRRLVSFLVAKYDSLFKETRGAQKDLEGFPRSPPPPHRREQGGRQRTTAIMCSRWRN